LYSSAVIWEKEKKGKFKALKTKHGLALEDGYQRYLSELQGNVEKSEGNGRIALSKKIEVNLFDVHIRYMYFCNS